MMAFLSDKVLINSVTTTFFVTSLSRIKLASTNFIPASFDFAEFNVPIDGVFLFGCLFIVGFGRPIRNQLLF
jgi:hypothetical protein